MAARGLAGTDSGVRLSFAQFEMSGERRQRVMPGRAVRMACTFPASVRALAQLGVVDRVHEIASKIDVQQIFDARGRLLNEVDLAAFWRRYGGCLSLSRSALRRVLSDALAGTPVRYGLPVARLQRDSADTLVTFSDRTRRTYDPVIGADGIQSTVRSAILAGKSW